MNEARWHDTLTNQYTLTVQAERQYQVRGCNSHQSATKHTSGVKILYSVSRSVKDDKVFNIL